MKIVISVPTGYHVRELLLTLKSHLEASQAIEKITCITPGAPYAAKVFSTYGPKFDFVLNPKTDTEHDALLKRLAPDLVITTTSGLDPNDVPILAAAKKRGIPTLTFIASWDNVWKMERLKNQNRGQVIADHIIVWNTMMRDHLLRVFPDLKPDTIHIIGAPRLDYFSHTDKIPSKRALFDYLGLADDTYHLIHFSTTELYPMDYIVRTIRQAIDSGTLPKNTYLYASVHPGGNMANHAALQKMGVTVRYSFGRRDDAPIKDFLYNPTLEEIYMLVAVFKHASLLINHSSTTAIESFLADVPIINVKYGRSFDWWHWYRSMVYRDFQQHYRDITADGATRVVKSERQLIQAAANYLRHPELDRDNRRLTARKMITTLDGTTSEQVMKVITSAWIH